jgi:hypothetical protein
VAAMPGWVRRRNAVRVDRVAENVLGLPGLEKVLGVGSTESVVSVVDIVTEQLRSGRNYQRIQALAVVEDLLVACGQPDGWLRQEARDIVLAVDKYDRNCKEVSLVEGQLTVVREKVAQYEDWLNRGPHLTEMQRTRIFGALRRTRVRAGALAAFVTAHGRKK